MSDFVPASHRDPFSSADFRLHKFPRNVEEFKSYALGIEITSEELELLAHIAAPPPTPELERMLIAWARGLATYGTPYAFFKESINEREIFTIGGNAFNSVKIINPGHALRRELITAQEPYPHQRPLEEYPSKLVLHPEECKLCGNIAQAYDAKFEGPGSPRRNFLFETDRAFITPNRYPAFPLDCLWIPKSHDDLSNRTESTGMIGNQMILPASPGKTRARVLQLDDLLEVFPIVDALKMMAVRNHPLDGMSLPAHDHFHLEPEFTIPVGYLDELLAVLEGQSVMTELPSSPFSTLAVRGRDTMQTAELGYEIMRRLESADQVWTMMYLRETILITPRRVEQISDRRIQVGGGISIHHFDAGREMEQILRFVPLRGEFDWAAYIP